MRFRSRNALFALVAALAFVLPVGAAEALRLVSPVNGATELLLRDGHRRFLAMPFAERVAFMLDKGHRQEMLAWKDKPRKIRLQWKSPVKDAVFAVEVVKLPRRECAFSAETRETTVVVPNLEVGREYAWSVAVRDASGRQVAFDETRFRTDGAAPRYLDVPGVPNLRDLGGWIGSDGRRVRQGLVYRSAGWNDNATLVRTVTNADGRVEKTYRPGKRRITDETARFVRETMGLRADLDLRSAGEVDGMTGSPVGEDVKWINISSRHYGSMARPDAKEAFAKGFRAILDPANRPIVFHCIGGADRTGCLAFALNGLLGVSEADLVRDWQLTGCFTPRALFNYDEFLSKFVAVLNAFPGKTLNDRIEAYVLSCGITVEEIAAWRELMLEPPEPSVLSERAAAALAGVTFSVGCVNCGQRHYGDGGKTPKAVYDAGWRTLRERYPQDVFIREDVSPGSPPTWGIEADGAAKPLERTYVKVSDSIDGRKTARCRALRLVYSLGGRRVAVYGLHLVPEGHIPGARDARGVSPSQRLRQRQFADLIADAQAFDEAVFCGDFNCQRPWEYAIFEKAGYALANCGTTYGQRITLRDIPADNIVVSSGFAIRSFRVVDDLTLDTDHRPLVATLVLSDAAADPRAAVVVPAKAPDAVLRAAEELKLHLEKATGTKIPVVREPSVPAVPHRFYVGPTDAAAKAGLPGRPLDPEERFVKVDGPAVYLLGGDRGDGTPADATGRTANGTLYAVCDFLETELGVRWLWPGETGTYVPRRRGLSFASAERRGTEPLVYRHLCYPRKPAKDARGFASQANYERLHADTLRHFERHRVGARENRNFGHSFAGWWEKYGKGHPEFFNLLPNGKREPLKGWDNGNMVSMCVSEPALHDELVRLAKGRGTKDFSVCENDVPGLCTCARCRAWDGPDPRFEVHPYWSKGVDPLTREGRFERFCHEFWDGKEGGAKELRELVAPTLSDRYLRFYGTVAAKARAEIDPAATVWGYAYGNYLEPPLRERVAPGVRIIFVPRTFYPYTAGESEVLRTDWLKWEQAGAHHMMFRPNYTLCGANLPVNYARRMADDFAWCRRHGMDAAFFDSLRGAWAAQAPTLYTLLRMLRDPEIGYRRALDEFCAAFGAAADDIRAYADLQESVQEGLTLERYFDLGTENRTRSGAVGGGFKHFVTIAADLFPFAWFAQADSVLGSAAKKVADDPDAAARVAFLRKGLEDARLTCRCRAVQKAGGDLKGTLEELRAYRASVEADGICDWTVFAAGETSSLGWWK